MKRIIVTVAEDFVPEEGGAFEAVVAALEHFEIPANLVEIDPAQSDDLRQVKFASAGGRTQDDEGAFFNGRNGQGYCTGVEVFRMENKVRLTPFSSRGIANCWVDIPREHAFDVAKALFAACR